MEITLALILGISAWVAIAILFCHVGILNKLIDGLIHVEKLQNLQMMHFKAVIQKLRQDLVDEHHDDSTPLT